MDSSANEITLKAGENLMDTIKASDKPVIVDYYADWCGPCKQLTPILHDKQAKGGNKFKIIKVNVDEHPDISGDISGIPYVVAYKDGKEVGNFTGLNEKSLDELISKL
jgi:thioredoxin